MVESIFAGPARLRGSNDGRGEVGRGDFGADYGGTLGIGHGTDHISVDGLPKCCDRAEPKEANERQV